MSKDIKEKTKSDKKDKNLIHKIKYIEVQVIDRKNSKGKTII